MRYSFWIQNRQKEYTFDPVQKRITISGSQDEIVEFTDIEVVEIYVPTNHKLGEGFIKLIFYDDRPSVFLTPLLPCFDILPDFFKDVEKQIVNKKIFGIFH